MYNVSQCTLTFTLIYAAQTLLKQFAEMALLFASNFVVVRATATPNLIVFFYPTMLIFSSMYFIETIIP